MRRDFHKINKAFTQGTLMWMNRRGATAPKYLRMATNTQASGIMIRPMVRDASGMQMETFIKVFGLMIRRRGGGSTPPPMVAST